MQDKIREALTGSLLGLMTGDALGLPFEGMSPGRIGKIARGPLTHRFLPGIGMVSDDTEHALLTALALIKTWSDPERYTLDLAWRLRWWMLRLPAGVGLATGRSIIKLWCGFPASRSGVYSAGNGPAMRAPVLGVTFADQPGHLRRYVKSTTTITHTDPKAYLGALAVAQAAAMASTGIDISVDDYLPALRDLTADVEDAAAREFMALMERVQAAVKSGEEIDDLIAQLHLQKGVTGYIYHTVPVILFLWLRCQDDFEQAMETVIRLGGDTDTNAAILGGIIGARVGKQGIPKQWLDNIMEWPWTVRYAGRIATTLAAVVQSGKPQRTPLLPGPLILIRNLLFLAVVLLHGFRRLLPPY